VSVQISSSNFVAVGAPPPHASTSSAPSNADASATRDAASQAERKPILTREGVLLDDQLVPLISGSVHYWRLERESWRECLETLREMGCTLVDVYVPWSVHEQADGTLDFGQRKPELDVVEFLRVAHDLGLYALLRPGPHINAELSGFGLPERVLWDRECQARSAAGEAVVLPMPPLAFPVPSYASRKLLNEARAWLTSVSERLGPLTWPQGPIVLCQVDNEGALYFRDGVYEQDYHPDSIARFRRFVEDKYGSLGAAAARYGILADNFEISAPVRFDAQDSAGLRRHLDWAEYQESLIADAFAEFRQAMAGAGLERAPTCHNLPMGESATPLDPTRLGKVVECLGMDYYHVAADGTPDAILKRTSEVATRADAFDYPAFAVELAAGFPPFFPPLTEHDNQFAALSCLAAGIRGYNLYMAVERDRWIGAPIDRFGVRRPSFDFWASLNEAVTRTKLYELSRAADVCIVIPRSLHRLERLLHAFGPVSAAAFDVMGLGAYDSCSEQGPFASALFESESFLRQLLAELTARGISYRVSGNDGAGRAVAEARASFVVSALGLEPALWSELVDAAGRGGDLRFGPRFPTTAPDAGDALAGNGSAAERMRLVDTATLHDDVEALAARDDVLRLEAGPGTRTSLFRDRGGAPRVLFVTNAQRTATTARLAIARIGGTFTEAVDALDGSAFRATVGALEVPLSPHSVRMLELK
jgi:beta-galactosidase